jgi:zinc protease
MSAAALVLSLLAAAPSLPGAPKIGPRPEWRAPVPEQRRTADGMELIVLQRGGLPLERVVIALRAGSMLDPPATPGLANATAHMLEEGGAGELGRLALEQAFEALGAELHVQCTEDGVFLSFSVLAPKLQRALELLAAVLIRPRFDAAAWGEVKERILAEILREKDDPEKLAHELFAELVFTGHPYGHDPLGTAPAIRALDRDALAAFHRAHYGPAVASLVLVGPVAPQAATEMVDRAFAGWTADVQPPATTPVERSRPRFVLVDRPGAPQSELRLGHTGPPRATPDFPALCVLEMVLGGSFTSRLNQDLRERLGYTYDIGAHFALLRAGGRLTVTSAVRTDVTAEAIAEIRRQLEAVRRTISEDELRKAAALVESGIVDSFGDGAQAALLFAELALGAVPLDRYNRLPGELGRLDLSGVQAVGERLILPDDLVIVVVGDRRKIERGLRALPGLPELEPR